MSFFVKVSEHEKQQEKQWAEFYRARGVDPYASFRKFRVWTVIISLCVIITIDALVYLKMIGVI